MRRRHTSAVLAGTGLAALTLIAAASPAVAPQAVGTVSGEATGAAQVQATIPSIRMDTTGMRVVTATGGSALSPAGGIPLQVRPTAVTVLAESPFTDRDLRAVLREGRIGVDVRWGQNGCSSTRWKVAGGDFGADGRAVPAPVGAEGPTEALTPGHQRNTCTRLVSADGEDGLVQRLAGHTILARTSWETVALPPVSWSSTGTTNVRRSIGLPPPVAPSGRACVSRGRSVEIAWSWPTATSTPIKGAAGVQAWSLHARPSGGKGAWTNLKTAEAGPSDRAETVTAAALRERGLRPGSYDLMLRAHPVAGSDSVYVDSATVWGVTLRDGRLSCGKTTKNTGPLLHRTDKG